MFMLVKENRENSLEGKQPSRRGGNSITHMKKLGFSMLILNKNLFNLNMKKLAQGTLHSNNLDRMLIDGIRTILTV